MRAKLREVLTLFCIFLYEQSSKGKERVQLRNICHEAFQSKKGKMALKTQMKKSRINLYFYINSTGFGLGKC